jgi:PAS domain S-box-containing protein
MLALEAEKVGTVIHINDELQRTLGHERKNLIGKKINTIQPTPISMVHDRILNRFLNTNKRKILNHNFQIFALTNEGYLRPIYLVVKLYPQMSDKIIIVGFIQCLKKIDGFDLPK